jgi:chromosome segregation ATPase
VSRDGIGSKPPFGMNSMRWSVAEINEMMVKRAQNAEAAKAALRKHAPDAEYMIDELERVHAENIRLEDMQDRLDKVSADRRAVSDRVAYLERELSVARDDIAVKTAELRTINRDSSPARIEERAAAMTTALQAELAASRAEAAELRSRVAELQTAKKRLREALERSKK